MRLVPNKTYPFKDKKYSGGKGSEERLIRMLTASVTGKKNSHAGD